jgi:hypothetical protein
MRKFIKKIDNFILNFNLKTFLYLCLSELFLIPYSFFIGMYNVPILFSSIIICGIYGSMYFFKKTIKEFYK